MMAPTHIRNTLAFTTLLLSSHAQAFGRFHPRNSLETSGFPEGHPRPSSVSVSIETACTATITARPGDAHPPSTGDGGGHHVHTVITTTTVTEAGPTMTIPGSTVTLPESTVTIPGGTVTVPGSTSTVTHPTTITVEVPLSQNSFGAPSSNHQEAEPTLSISSPPSGSPASPTPAIVTDDSTYSWSWENSGLGPSKEVYSGVFNGGINGGFSEGFTLGYSGAYTEYGSPRNTEVASSASGGSHIPTACGVQTVAKTVFSTVTRTLEPGTGIASSSAPVSTWG
ncbi:hypothetical protein VPNG_08931 [Cytospora leucostoma]|uniref:Uncharacterized protein n=1 Tax=Cytospora leucostoma TaxID=1230097 RepID=A0A423VWP7_9PEZI|nr:hypothetical protein VPNG_08931 [Cytospora leucostoma]